MFGDDGQRRSPLVCDSSCSDCSRVEANFKPAPLSSKGAAPTDFDQATSSMLDFAGFRRESGLVVCGSRL